MGEEGRAKLRVMHAAAGAALGFAAIAMSSPCLAQAAPANTAASARTLPAASPARSVTSLRNGWRFQFGDAADSVTVAHLSGVGQRAVGRLKGRLGITD